jgi:hypothetical protein
VFRAWNGQGSLVEFIVSLNLHRRHLDCTQIAVVAFDIVHLQKEEAKERQRKAGETTHSNQHSKKEVQLPI